MSTRKGMKTAAAEVNAKPARKRASNGDGVWELRLYIAGRTERSETALANLKRICEKHLTHKYKLEIIDLVENPTLARGDQILAVPTLVRRLPPPLKKVIGDLSNTERVLVGLNLRPVAE